MIKHEYPSEKRALAEQVFHNLEKWGITELPVLEKGDSKDIFVSQDKSIRIQLVSTGHKQGYFKLRQEDRSGLTYHLRSEIFSYE